MRNAPDNRRSTGGSPTSTGPGRGSTTKAGPASDRPTSNGRTGGRPEKTGSGCPTKTGSAGDRPTSTRPTDGCPTKTGATSDRPTKTGPASGCPNTAATEGRSAEPRFALRLLPILALVLSGIGCGGGDSTTDPKPPDPTPYSFQIPESFPVYQEPADNPATVEGVALGRRLFYDRILSGDRSQSCGDCHQQAFGFSDEGKRFSLGIDGTEGNRNTPPIFNAAWAVNLFWDGRAPGLEAQAREPVENPIEMHLSWDEAVARVAAEGNYPPLFAAAFGDPAVTQDRILKAIGQFERTLISADSKYDQWLRGDAELTPSEARGYRIFFTEEGDCFHCHGNILFTDVRFHDIGLDLAPSDSGRAQVTKDLADYGKFKTPSLRNIEYTAPYMHDGRFEALNDVLDHYDLNVNLSPNLDPLILTRFNRGPALDEQDRTDLIAFLKTLSDPAYLTDPDNSNPFQR